MGWARGGRPVQEPIGSPRRPEESEAGIDALGEAAIGCGVVAEGVQPEVDDTEEANDSGDPVG